MKLSFTLMTVALWGTSQGFTLQRSTSRSFVCRVATQEDPFAAFEDALEDEEFAATQPWQSKLEEVLDPTTSLAQRQILLSELLGSNQEIRDSVQTALQERNIDPLLTPNAKRLQDGTRAVARQLTNDILPAMAQELQTPPSPEEVGKLGNRVFKAFQSQVKNVLEDPTRIVQDLPQEIAKEARNVFSEMPEGLVGPGYKVVAKFGEYEIREYESYKVASTPMGSTPYVGSSTAFNALAAYLFGANQDSKVMEMTTPVATTSQGDMQFFLQVSGSEPPQPLTDDSIYDTGAVQLLDVPPALLAVRKFTGFVTEGEVARQKEQLVEQLALDTTDYEIDVPHGQTIPHLVFQYNPPYTVPFVRKNEIAVPIRKAEDTTLESLESQWAANDKDAADDSDLAPSDVE